MTEISEGARLENIQFFAGLPSGCTGTDPLYAAPAPTLGRKWENAVPTVHSSALLPTMQKS